jgi:DNA-directed RNA polymerase subunit beta'
MMDKRAPEIILKNEKRLLQDAVDALLDNSGKEKPVTDSSGRPLKSLTDILVKKEGRFRKNLLGKRVDYSGRSVIVIGPELELDQCGLPKEMAVELFKPFLINRLIKRGIAETFKEARELIDRRDDSIFDALEEVVKDHYVLLNRAPTLHRPSIEAFRPVLVDMKAISIPAMVCPPFNADFDGDQMAVHVPLSDQAQAEARLIMASSLNFISPANGTPLAAPSQDMVLGIYYLTMPFEGVKGEGSVISSVDEAFIRYRLGKADLHAWVWYPLIASKEEIEKMKSEGKKGNTTIGRIIFNYEIGKRMKQYGLTRYLGKGFEIFKEDADEKYKGPRLDFVNETLDKKKLKKLITEMVDIIGIADMKYFLDVIKDIGFHYATVSGSTISLQEVQVMPGKDEILNRALEQVERINEAYEDGIISYEERIPSIIEVWRRASEEIEANLRKLMSESAPDKLNSLYIMIISGARGNVDQLRQSVAFRGAVYDATGNILEIPVKSSYIEGLTVREYFDSTYGGRKGQVDTALSTSLGGYNTRRFEEAVHAIVVREDDHEVKDVDLNVYQGRDLAHEIMGRLAAEDIVDSQTGEVIVKKFELIDEEKFVQIQNKAAGKVKVFTELMWVDVDSFLDDENFLENLIHNRFKLAMDIVLKNGDSIPAGTVITPVLVHKLKKILEDNGYEPKVLVRRIDGIMFRTLKNLEGDNIKDFFARIKGRFLADDVVSPKTGEVLAQSGQYIDKELIDKFKEHGVDHVYIKSALTCKTEYGVCVKCYGEDLARHAIVERGEAVGIVAAQSLGEPATQLTLRTFHTGGTVGAKSEEITSEDSGLRLVEAVSTTPDSGLNKDERRFLQSIVKPITDFYKVIRNIDERIRAEFDSAKEDILVKEISNLKEMTSSEEKALRVYVNDFLDSYMNGLLSIMETIQTLINNEFNWRGLSADIYEYIFEQIDNLDKVFAPAVLENLKKGIDDIVSNDDITSRLSRKIESYLASISARFVEYLAKLPSWFLMTAGIKGRNAEEVKALYDRIIGMGVKDITDDARKELVGLIKGLFEGDDISVKEFVYEQFVGLDPTMEILDQKRAKLQPLAMLSSVDGHVVEVEVKDKMMYVITKDEFGSYKLAFAWMPFRYLDPVLGREVDIRFRPRFKEGDYILPGDLMVVSRQRGFHRPVVRYPRVFLQMLLDNFGLQAVADFLFSSIEGIYVDFQFDINDKHFEVIMSQMLSKVEVYDDGDSDILVPFHDVDLYRFEAEYRYLKTKGLLTPRGKRKIWGTKDVGKLSESWLAAASYLETATALINAAIASKVDRLVGMKENVIVGSMIPAGTGIYDDSQFKIRVEGKEEIIEEE